MASPESVPPADAALRQEVERLSGELNRATEKLNSWKEKAKIGVEQLRGQVVALTAELERAQQEKSTLQHRLTVLETASRTAEVSQGSTERHGTDLTNSSSPSMLALLRDEADAFVTQETKKVDLFTTAALALARKVPPGGNAKSEGSPASPVAADEEEGTTSHGASIAEDFDAYKRRVTMTLRLQTKNCETLQRQVEELKKASESAKTELREKTRTLASRAETLTLLEQRLEVAERRSQELEANQASMLAGTNMDQVSALEDRLEEEVARVRSEFSARENAIFAQHQDELERMRALNEEELLAMRRDSEERLSLAVATAAQQVATEQSAQRRENTASGTSATVPKDDAAYATLLSEYESLETRYRRAQTENTELRDSIAKGTREVPSNSATMPSEVQWQKPLDASPVTLTDAKGVIDEQTTALQSMSQQLWDLKKQLLDYQRREKNTVAPAGTLDPQQAAYLKSIVIKSMCAKGDDSILSNLLPVFSSLLSFSGDELKRVCIANPSWMAKK